MKLQFLARDELITMDLKMWSTCMRPKDNISLDFFCIFEEELCSGSNYCTESILRKSSSPCEMLTVALGMWNAWN